jgi:hypothetical protein
MLDQFFAFIKVYQQELIEERAATLEGRVVNAIHELLVVNQQEVVASSEVAALMNEGVAEKRQVTAARVGRVLKSLGLKTGVKREGKKTVRELQKDLDLLESLYKRYVPAALSNADSVTSVTDVTVHTRTTEFYNNDAATSKLQSAKQGSSEPAFQKTLKENPISETGEVAVPTVAVTSVTPVTPPALPVTILPTEPGRMPLAFRIREWMRDNDGDVVARTPADLAAALGANEFEVLNALGVLSSRGDALQAPDGSWVVRRRE